MNHALVLIFNQLLAILLSAIDAGLTRVLELCHGKLLSSM